MEPVSVQRHPAGAWGQGRGLRGAHLLSKEERKSRNLHAQDKDRGKLCTSPKTPVPPGAAGTGCCSCNDHGREQPFPDHARHHSWTHRGASFKPALRGCSGEKELATYHAALSYSAQIRTNSSRW